MALSKETKGFIKRVREIKALINPTLKQVFTVKKAEVIKINTEQQLYDKGENALKISLKIKNPYAFRTKLAKRRKGQPTDRVTLKDTGAFYSSFKVIPRNNEVEITATAEYTKYLLDKYGEEILGLQEEFLKTFYEDNIEPKLEKKINDKLTKF